MEREGQSYQNKRSRGAFFTTESVPWKEAVSIAVTPLASSTAQMARKSAAYTLRSGDEMAGGARGETGRSAWERPRTSPCNHAKSTQC